MLLKKYVYLVTVLSGIMLMSCEDLLKDLITFDSDYTYINFTINPENETGEKVFDTVIVKSELEKWLDDAGFSIDDVESVKLKEASFEIQNVNQDINFNDIASASASISTVNDPEIIIASKDQVPSNVRNVSLDVNSTNLKDYLTENEYIFTASGFVSSPITDTIEVQAKIKFTID